MPDFVPWCLRADGSWTVELGELGCLVVRPEPTGYRWSAAALGKEQCGHLSAGAAKSAAIRLARQQLVDALRTLVSLESMGRSHGRAPGKSAPPASPRAAAEVVRLVPRPECGGMGSARS